MKLRAKMPLIVGLTMAGLFVMLLVLADLTLITRSNAMESEAALATAGRLSDALDADLRQLDRTALMWAARGDTYRFMEDRVATEIDSDLTDDSLANLGINFMLFIDNAGSTVRADFLDLDLGTRIQPDQATISVIESDTRLVLQGDPRAYERGFLKLPGGVALVVARPITTADMYAAPHGTLVLGRYLGEWEVDRLSNQLGIQVEAAPADSTGAATFTGAGEGGGSLSTRWWRPLDNSTLASYAMVTGLDGEPLMSLKAELPRDIRAQGTTWVWYTSISLLLIGLAATSAVFIALDHGVLSRLSRLAAEVDRVRESGDVTGRLSVEGHDELSELAEEVNAMLSSLEIAERRVEAVNEELERRVEERTNALTVSEGRYRGLLDRMADAVFCVDLEGRITLMNERAAEIVGVKLEEILGMRFSNLVGNVSSEQVEVHATDASDRDAVWTIEVPFGLTGRDAVPVELRGTAIVDEAGGVAGTQWIVRDMTERKKMEQQLLHMASHDHLTGLRNRRSFEQALEMRLAEMRRTGGEGAVVWLDLDDFKAVNDSLGHRAGDEVLVTLSEQLRKQVRESNMLARLGGDEFAVLLAGVTEEEAETAAARILSEINSFTYVIEGRTVRLSASVGVVSYPRHGTTVEELLANADLAMYQAKESGRSRVHVHTIDDVWRESLMVRMDWNERITHALDNDGFVLCAQPLLDLRENRIARYELLIRLMEDDELVMPAEFLPTAERLGLIHDIDRWVVKEAIRLLASTSDPATGLDVNLSGKAFADPNLLPFVAEMLDRERVDPSRLGFEITETAAIADVTRAQELIGNLKDLGCRFSLDDFGSGFSSFYYLKHLAIDCLKVDGSFIRALPRSKQDQHLVRGMVEMCRGLGIEVVAEYVEDEEILLAVGDLGVDYAQGYHVGRPAPVAQVLKREAS